MDGGFMARLTVHGKWEEGRRRRVRKSTSLFVYLTLDIKRCIYTILYLHLPPALSCLHRRSLNKAAYIHTSIQINLRYALRTRSRIASG